MKKETVQNEKNSQDSSFYKQEVSEKALPQQTQTISYSKGSMTQNAEARAQGAETGTTQNHTQATELCPNQGMADTGSTAFQKCYGSVIAICDAQMGWIWRSLDWENESSLQMNIVGRLHFPRMATTKSPILYALSQCHFDIPHQQEISLPL